MTAIVAADFTTLDDDKIKKALREALFLRGKMIAAQLRLDGMNVHPDYRASGQNLLSYLALRRHDIRPLQLTLGKLGLSSLGRCEANALASVDRVIEVLQRLIPGPRKARSVSAVALDLSEQLLASHTQALFGGEPAERGVRIMVTMPSEASSDFAQVKNLLKAGMDCQRINCAHDTPEDWLKMIEHVRRAQRTLGRPCSVMLDLAGPGLRTGVIDPPPAVVRIRPTRDVFGRVTQPARLWLCMDEQAYADAALSIKLPGKWLAQLEVNDIIALRDARESKRRMRISEVTDSGCWAELEKTAYVVPGVTLNLKHRKGRKKSARVLGVSRSTAQSIKLHEGDLLMLTQDTGTGRPAARDKWGNVTRPATIGCTLGQAFGQVRAGEPIWFDDGKIGGTVQQVENDALHILITHAPGGVRLKSDKGIHLPASDLKLDVLSPDDLHALAFACQHADAVQISFVDTAEDVNLLVSHLTRLGAHNMGVVLKIATRRSVENLAELLVAGMQLPRLGVMIASGDLAMENGAVESGFECTAPLQEEILRLCKAAHVPVIRATQGLETLTKTANPSRTEIAEAASGVRAECVMLNNGAHILTAIRSLDEVFNRMQPHRPKTFELMDKQRETRSPTARRASLTPRAGAKA